MTVSSAGSFAGLSGIDGQVGVSTRAAANIISFAKLKDAGYKISYDNHRDLYTVTGDNDAQFIFTRKSLSNGSKSCHYACDLNPHRVMVETVAENERRYTKRELEDASKAKYLQEKMAYPSVQSMVNILNHGVMNCPVTKADVYRSDSIWGKSPAYLMGKTKKKASLSTAIELSPRVTQKQQTMAVDIMFVKGIPFLVGVMVPLNFTLCSYLKDRSAEHVGAALQSFIAEAKSKGFDIIAIQCDGEGAISQLKDELARQGIQLDVASPGNHVPVVERKNQTIKQRVRIFNYSLPYIMTQGLIRACVLFCVRCINFQPSAASMDAVSPQEQFSGRKPDALVDFAVGFGEYVQATVPNTDNSMHYRTEGCISLGSVGNVTRSVRMLCLRSSEVVTRNQYKVLPMPDDVINRITARAKKQGYTRDMEPDTARVIGVDDDNNVAAHHNPLPDMMQIDNRAADNVIPSGDDNNLAHTESGVSNDSSIIATDEESRLNSLAASQFDYNLRGDLTTAAEETRPIRSTRGNVPIRYLDMERNRPEVTLVVHPHSDWDRAAMTSIPAEVDNPPKELWNAELAHIFKISVKKALRTRGAEATDVITAELQQMLDKKVFHPVHTKDLTDAERQSIIRSTMFLKDKYNASGEWEKFKARLVAGGDQQDRSLYDNLSSPTASTTSVLTVASIAAAERRIVETSDIGGAYLNTDMEGKVLMRLNKEVAQVLIAIDSTFAKFQERSGAIVLMLDKALYGTVQASSLWYKDLSGKLRDNGFEENPYDACVFNKYGPDGKQITIALHVDDLLITSESQDNLDTFNAYLTSVYPEVNTKRGKILDYIGMTFDFSTEGEVRVTMENCVNDILMECGVTTARATPAASNLFETRDTIKATVDEVKWFRSNTAKVLYLAKRVRPECLTSVAFLTTRVEECDIDDLAKLRRLLGYIVGTRHRGIILKIGEYMTIQAYIDAAYGVHSNSGKSHTGCAIVIGESGAVYAKSSKQRIVTKSSTEAELVGLSDTASQAIHLRNFVIAQGYEVGPAIIYQDNLSCMALMKRGNPSSERSRHINIRHFWLKEKVDEKEIIIEHLGTEEMFANALTKPVQGSQFYYERKGLTNWDD